MYETYVPGFSNYLTQQALGIDGGYQSLPTEQPVYAELAPPEIDLGGWNITDYQKQVQQGGGIGGLNLTYDPGPAYDPNMVYRFDTGDKIGVPDGNGGWTYRNAAPVVFNPGEQYILTDKTGQNVLGRASTPEEMQKLVDMSSSNKEWALHRADAQGNYELGGQLFDRSNAGSFGSMILPMAGIAGLALGATALGLGGGFGAGAGAGAGGAGGAIGAAGGVGGVGGTVGTVGASAGGLGGLAAAAQPLITVVAPSAAGLGTAGTLALGGTLAGGLAAATAAPGTGAINYGNQLWGAQPEAPITVIGNPSNLGVGTIPGVTAGGALTAGAALSGGGVQAPPAQQPVDPEIVVEATRNPPVTGSGLSLGDIATLPLGTTLAQPMTPNVPTQDIPPAQGMTVTEAIKKGLSVADYMQLAGLGIGALGSLFGGGGGNQTAGRWPGGSTPNPTFNASLPQANIPGLSGSSGTPRTAADLGNQGLRTTQDWYRYGYGPQQSFFNYVPQAQPNTSQAYTGYAAGGSVVEGPGDGREDKIPAMLSDGEYVMDAETVALLGNGSNKAGADMLDQFRVNIRKHKGRELSRGGFSEDAMRPEHYLAGGLA